MKKKFKTKSVAKALSEKYGGKWKYEYPCYWRCDDGNRYVANVCNGVDYKDESTGSRKCLYYEDNSKPPEWIYSI